MEEEP